MVKISRDLRFRIKNLFIHFSKYVWYRTISRFRAEKINGYFHLPSRKIRERVVEKLFFASEKREVGSEVCSRFP